MAYMVKCPGSCGELVQGQIDGLPFLVTCPIDRFSFVEVGGGRSGYLPAKAQAALKASCQRLQVTQPPDITLTSQLPIGKGMASSSADISAICMAASLAVKQPFGLEELADLALSIEPSDAIFHPGIVQFDYLHGAIMNFLGWAPPLKIAMFDTGGVVDTLEFNRRQDLFRIRAKHENSTQEALQTLTSGLRDRNPREIGKATTMSAYANQEILYRPYLDTLVSIANQENAYGVIIAHSGTVCGILTETENISALRSKVQEKLRGELQWLDAVSIYNEGIQYWETEIENESI